MASSIEKKEILNLEIKLYNQMQKNLKLHNPLEFFKNICQPLKNSVGVLKVLVTLALFNSFHLGLFNTIGLIDLLMTAP